VKSRAPDAITCGLSSAISFLIIARWTIRHHLISASARRLAPDTRIRIDEPRDPACRAAPAPPRISAAKHAWCRHTHRFSAGERQASSSGHLGSGELRPGFFPPMAESSKVMSQALPVISAAYIEQLRHRRWNKTGRIRRHQGAPPSTNPWRSPAEKSMCMSTPNVLRLPNRGGAGSGTNMQDHAVIYADSSNSGASRALRPKIR